VTETKGLNIRVKYLFLFKIFFVSDFEVIHPIVFDVIIWFTVIFPSGKYVASYLAVTCELHASYLRVTCELHASYLRVT
jgi:hypothetical protein